MPMPIARFMFCAALVALAACAGKESMSPASEAAESPPSADMTWELQSWSGKSLAALGDQRVTLAFTADGLRSQGPCNSMSGSAKLGEKTLVVGTLARSKKYCAETMALEDAWIAFFGGPLAVERPAADRLVLVAADGTRLEFRAAP
jgi:heat shock protein HslJ